MTTPKTTQDLTIYDLGVSFTWQPVHAHQFYEESLADLFGARVEGLWRKVPSEDAYHRPVWKVTNDAGCFVCSFDVRKLQDSVLLADTEHVPAEMLKNLNRQCFLKLVPGMENKHDVNHRGIPVEPVWDDRDLTGKTPRMFRIVGFQRNFRGDVCYRVHQMPDAPHGRCAGPDDVIVVSMYAVTTPPSWHQQRAGHIYGSILLLWMTDAEVEDFRSRLDADSTLHTREGSPHIWENEIPKLMGEPKSEPRKKK